MQWRTEKLSLRRICDSVETKNWDYESKCFENTCLRQKIQESKYGAISIYYSFFGRTKFSETMYVLVWQSNFNIFSNIINSFKCFVIRQAFGYKSIEKIYFLPYNITENF